jgi:hypothetical protein
VVEFIVFKQNGTFEVTVRLGDFSLHCDLLVDTRIATMPRVSEVVDQ